MYGTTTLLLEGVTPPHPGSSSRATRTKTSSGHGTAGSERARRLEGDAEELEQDFAGELEAGIEALKRLPDGAI